MKKPELRATTSYLHEHIPLAKAMQVEVVAFDGDSVTLHAPLQPNLNHRGTGFGGSAVSLALLAGWTLLHLNQQDADLDARVVVQTSTMNYRRPIVGDFTARSYFPDKQQWRRFLEMVQKKHMARIELPAVLTCNGETVAEFSGKYVALLTD